MRYLRSSCACLLCVISASCSSSSPPLATRGDSGSSQAGIGEILFTASGEALALTGYRFPPAPADLPALGDGWNLHFDRLLTTIDKITLSGGPDKSKGDQSQTDGVVA